MCDLSKTKLTDPSNAIKHIAWKEPMTEEYQSIMKMTFGKLFLNLKENLLFLQSGYLK